MACPYGGLKSKTSTLLDMFPHILEPPAIFYDLKTFTRSPVHVCNPCEEVALARNQKDNHLDTCPENQASNAPIIAISISWHNHSH